MTEGGTVARRDQGPAPAARGSQQSSSTLADTLQLGEVLVASGFLPKAIRTKEQAATVILKGKELSLPPMQALSSIAVIDGKPTLSAELMVALVQRAGHTLRVVETSSERAVVDGIRREDPEHTSRIEWSMEDARRAGVTNKDPWKKYPDAMLRARAISALCRFAFADVLAGCSYVPEELGADVDSEGAVIEPPAPVRGIESRELARRPTEPSHDALIEQVERGLDELPEANRPPREQVLQYARAKPANARAALERVERIKANLAESRAEFDEHDEAESEDEDAPANGEPENEPPRLGDDQYTYIHDIAEELYSEKSTRWTGVQYLERQIGQALTTLTPDEATALIRNLDQEYREGMNDE